MIFTDFLPQILQQFPSLFDFFYKNFIYFLEAHSMEQHALKNVNSKM
jgi:hypothetical protein